MTVSGRWQLHPLHLYLVRTALRLEDLTLPLEGPSYGQNSEQVSQIAKREFPTMETLGIIKGGEIAPGLRQALEVLTKPYLWLDSVWFPDMEVNVSWRSIAAFAEDNRIILGVQTPGEDERYGGMLTVEVHEKVPMSQVILPTLPPAPPGKRGAARVPASSFSPHGTESEDSFLQASGTSGPASSGDRQLALYRAIGAARHVRGGQFAANMRDRNGIVKRSSIVRWFDNEQPDGRYLDHNERGNTGEQMYMLTPADAGLIGKRLDALTASVR